MTEVDIRYLRDKGVPLLLEALAAEIVTKKPDDPEAYLRQKYSMTTAGASTDGEGGAAGNDGTNAREEITIYCRPRTATTSAVLAAAAMAGAKYKVVEITSNTRMPVEVTPCGILPAVAGGPSSVTASGVGACLRLLSRPLPPALLCEVDSASEAIAHLFRATVLGRDTPLPNNVATDQEFCAALDNSFSILSSNYFKHSTWLVTNEATIADTLLLGVMFQLVYVAGFTSDVLVGSHAPVKKWWDAMQKEGCFAESHRDIVSALASGGGEK